jgi:hypothetical protein
VSQSSTLSSTADPPQAQAQVSGTGDGSTQVHKRSAADSEVADETDYTHTQLLKRARAAGYQPDGNPEEVEGIEGKWSALEVHAESEFDGSKAKRKLDEQLAHEPTKHALADS